MKNTLFAAAFFFTLSINLKAQSAVTFYTNHGNFTAELYDSLKPITAGNFKNLVDSKYYDGVIFHRIISGFVIQGGDPTGTGTGGPGYTIQDEFSPLLSNVVKTLSMANSGPNTGGSQFFINMKNNTFLDFNKAPTTSAHPVFGVVRDGWTVVKTIEAVAVDGNDRPVTDVRMDSVRTTGSFLSLQQIAVNTTKTEIYPNPITSESVLDIYNAYSGLVSFKLYAPTGQLIRAETRRMQEGKTLIPLNELGVLQLLRGVYLLEIQKENETLNEKIVIN